MERQAGAIGFATRILSDDEAFRRALPALRGILKPSTKAKILINELKKHGTLKGRDVQSLWNVIAHFKLEVYDDILVQYATDRAKGADL